MANITITSADDAGFDPAYVTVREVETEDVELGSGGFGTVYPCLTINGSAPPVPLVIKVFKDVGTGIPAQNNLRIKALLEQGLQTPGDSEDRLGFYVGQLALTDEL